MAEPPTRRPGTTPPPIPALPRVPIAPSAARTDLSAIVQAPEDEPEDTRNIELPDASVLVEHMLELVGIEAEALLSGDDDARRSDLNVRTALATWDVLHQPDEAMRLLELAERHPLAPRLRLQVALADPAALASIASSVLPAELGSARRSDDDELATDVSIDATTVARRNALALELAEAWLWRHGRIAEAGALFDRLLRADVFAPYVGELAILTHAAAGNWARVIELRVASASAPDEIASLAALMLDRASDAPRALATAWAKLEHYPGPSDAPLGWLRVFDIAIEAASRTDDERRFELLDKRAELVSALPGGAHEALATRFAVAAELERVGDRIEAGRLWIQLAADPGAQVPGQARRVALLHAAWSGAGGLPAHRALADSSSSVIAAAHAWRALELAALANDPSAIELARAVGDAGGRVAERYLDLLELADPGDAAIARFERRGGMWLRAAAAVAERRGHRDRAVALWQRAAELPQPLTTRDHVVRLQRANERDEDQLSTLYAQWAEAEHDPRAAAALWCARGVVDLARGDFVEAEESLRRAAEKDPKDPFCRAALAAVYRANKSYAVLAQVLSELATQLVSRDARAAAAREYAELLDEHLGDPTGARAALERMIEDRPEDANAMLVLARLYEREQLWLRAIELRKRAAELAPGQRAEIYAAIAASEEKRGNLDAALAALDQAGGDKNDERLRLLKGAGRLEDALEVVRTELAAEPLDDRRVALNRELALILTQLGREPESIVDAWLEVLAIEPDREEALAGIQAPARQLGQWDELARAFRGARPTPEHLEVLGEALEKIAEWSELVEVRRRQLDAAVAPPEKASRATDLARIYEQELGDTDGAIRMLLLAQAVAPEDNRQRTVLALLRTADRWAEVAAVLERELPTVRSTDVQRQLEILLELGDLRANRLNRQADAATAYELVLERHPEQPIATAALEKLYEALGRDRELARILETKAEASTDGAVRCALFARVGNLRSNRGDIDGALAAYTAGFASDPTNRDVFTAMERVCYKAERWAAAMELYDAAIQHVESGKSRAYRLGDLYSRRANVMLNFLGNIDGAIEAYQKVIEVDSSPDAAIKALEELCKKRNDYQPLIAAYEKRAGTQRDSTRRADALRAAAQLALTQSADPRQSVRLNRALLQIDPSDREASASLEAHFEDEQDKSGLIEILKLRLTSARSQADSIELLKKIARTSEEGARDVHTATEHYQKILELDPNNRDALDALGRIYESTEQWAEFIDITRKQIKVTTDRNTKALLYFRCGSVMEAKFGREHDAIRYYDAAIKTSSSCLPAVHGLRDLYRRREEWPRVIETLELEVKLWNDDKERAGVFAQIGRIYDKQLGDSERAMQFYESALTVDPDCLPANQALFEHFFDAGEWDKAEPIANALAQKAMRDGEPSTRADFYRKRGTVARMTGDPRAAAESFIVALEIKPNSSEALDALGSLARDVPDAWDFDSTYRELEKLYKKRDDADELIARVHVGRAAIIERAGDLDIAAELYKQAAELAGDDSTILMALVEFHADMRHWDEAVAAIARFVKRTTITDASRLTALMRRAELHAEGEMNAPRAIAVLREVLAIDGAHQDAYYQLAQQLFLVGEYAEARTAIERVIELATAPGQPLVAASLARYYYYKGRILDAAGDTRGAAPQYRRAIDYDPGYAPPALVLARRAADAGDQRQAETLLIEAAHAAMAQGGPRAAVPLQRGLARILLASGDRPAAIEAYRGILNVEPDGASDRVALAEIYAVDDPVRAISELRKVLERDIHHAPAYRLLASFYSRTGDTERAQRVLTALDLLGFAEETDRTTMQRLRANRVPDVLHQPLDEAARHTLLTPAAKDPLGEVFTAFAEEISAIVSSPSLGVALMPAESVGDQRLLALAAEVAALYQTEAQIFVGEKVPGLAAVTAFPQRMLVIDRSLLTESDLALRFLLGYAFEAIRGGYALLFQLGARQRRELAQLLRTLVMPEREGAAAELVARASARSLKVLEKYAGLRDVDPGAWMDGMLACAKRAGLVACDDFAAAIWMVARLSGEKLESHDATVALGSVLGGPDLVRFYLSDDYQALRDQLA